MNIVITGAGRGIGFETAIELSKDPNNRIIALSRNQSNLDKLYNFSKNVGHGNIIIYKMDVTDFDKKDLVGFIQKNGGVDILINNAGQLINKSFSTLSILEWRMIFEINLFAAVEVITTLMPLLKNANPAHIINIGSMGGFQGSSKFVGLSAYSASKAALANLTECLAEELKEFGIRVNCLALGAVDTEMVKEAFPDYTAPISTMQMAKFISHFSLTAHYIMNGKIIPVSITTP